MGYPVRKILIIRMLQSQSVNFGEDGILLWGSGSEIMFISL